MISVTLPRAILRFAVSGSPVVAGDRLAEYEGRIQNAGQAMVRQAGWTMVPGDTYGIRLVLYRRRNQGAWDEYAAMVQRALKGICIPGREAVVDAHVRVLLNRINPHSEVTVIAFAGRADADRSPS